MTTETFGEVGSAERHTDGKMRETKRLIVAARLTGVLMLDGKRFSSIGSLVFGVDSRYTLSCC